MDCFYINLDSASERRAGLESGFRAHARADWTLTRFPAIDADAVRRRGIRGAASDGEKACFLSHRELIGSHGDAAAPVFVLEDDARFGSGTCRVVDWFVRNNARLDWDLLFTDVVTTKLDDMAGLVKLRRQLMAEQRIVAIDLATMSFAGTTAYVVNPRAIGKLRELLDGVAEIDAAYDLHVANLVNRGVLKAYALFPFVTTVSSAAGVSQIQGARKRNADLVWQTFREMIWLERDEAVWRPELQRIREQLLDDELMDFAVLFAAPASAKFVAR
jgi:GR25 family glycosyltransferase involved in LPS biosynthesis